MPEHRTLVSADVHEPKHMTDSTGADAGKVITPLGSGTSELRRLTPDEVGVVKAYGEAGVDQHLSSPFSVPAATDSTLYTESDYIPLNSARVSGVALDETYNTTFDDVNNTLTPDVDGVYAISFWMNVKTDAVDNLIGVKAKTNGVWANFTVKNEIQNSSRVQNISGFITKQLVAGEPVSLHVASEKNCDMDIEDFRFEIILLREV